MFYLVPNRDDVLSAAQTDSEKPCQSRHRFNSLLPFPVFNQPDNDIQRIIQEMRVNLILQSHQLAPAFGLMLLHNIRHKPFQVFLHLADCLSQMPDLVKTGGLYLGIQIPRLNLVDRFLQPPHGCRNLPRKEGID